METPKDKKNMVSNFVQKIIFYFFFRIDMNTTCNVQNNDMSFTLNSLNKYPCVCARSLNKIWNITNTI